MNLMKLYCILCIGFMGIVTMPREVLSVEMAQISDFAEASSFRVELANLNPACDREPGPALPRTYILAELKFFNRSDHPMHFQIKRATISFNANEEGLEKSISLRNNSGLATGETNIRVPVGEHRINLRGDAVFEDNRADQELYLTLTLSTPQGEMTVRKSAQVRVGY